MNARERVSAVLRRETPDRIPVMSLCWTYGAKTAGATVQEYASNPKIMGEGQIKLWEQTGIDILNPCCDVGATASAWDVEIKFLPDITPQISGFAVKAPEDWEKLPVVDPHKDGRMPVIVEANRLVHEKLGDNAVACPYTPSPLTCATHLRNMSDVLVDILVNPGLLHKGLKSIAGSLKEYNKALFEANNQGILYASTRASAEIVTTEQYREFGTPYDNITLSGLVGTDAIVIHHCCGLEPFFEELIGMSLCHGINWWDRGSKTDLSTAIKKYRDKTCLVGGIDQTKTVLYGSPADVENEGKNAIESAESHPFILAPGCEIQSLAIPIENVKAMVSATEKFSPSRK